MYVIGNFLKTESVLVEFGNHIRWLTIPGEMCPEIYTGLPENFDDSSSVPVYYRNPTFHAVGINYTFPGNN